ncbi:IS982 family transposase [Sulfurimonas sediminis]|uniref:IS982 family transposase n=1 Tax=Sulfurimonas sediminis TaxID=2590020 RepID=A0A7M1B4B5_9BACT|nr:IS982 family transposase [Sulfurimonas sediminis]QOP44571.1 IS982 family transposase [Sulfurimonas sediminis]
MILTKLFVEIDACMKIYEQNFNVELIKNGKKHRKRDTKLSLSEIMTIVVYFHMSGYRTFKNFYRKHICTIHREAFPCLVSYNRFVELIPRVLLPLSVFMKTQRTGSSTGITFVDSTTIDVCHNRRIHQHKVFKGIAQRGKSSTGWFYGFKLVNEFGEIVNFAFTPGNTDDRNEELMLKLTKNISGKLIGDKGYLSQKLFDLLWKNGTQPITKIKKNMKNKLMPLFDKLLLRKRALIESINDQLKNISQLEHSRHRSPTNAMVNWVAALVAYSYQPKKPSINFANNQRKMIVV